MFEVIDNDTQDAVIKVIGVGGCGQNAVDHMIKNDVHGVDFIAANTDAQALKLSLAKNQLQIGTELTRGLGAGANPEIGRDAAIEDRDRIIEHLDGADMVFITAGMGGGTGTGAAPVIAEIARELGILTVAVVTRPFRFEGKRAKVADAGVAELSKHVDSLIIVPNEKLMQVLGDDVTLLGAYEAANGVLQGAVGGIAEIINCPGLVNVDFADVKRVMSTDGSIQKMAMMGSATATGPHRAKQAAEAAVKCPLLEDVDITGAQAVLVNITASDSFKMRELHEVMDAVQKLAGEDVEVIVGNVFNNDMGDQMRVTVVATGLGQNAKSQSRPLSVVRTGTDNYAVGAGETDYNAYDQPAVIRRRARDAQVDAMKQQGVEHYDIPAFLRKQAD